ncbi:MAG TPA: winged helix-turn-helix domain-containing protein [Ilumatobacter sp.]|nr:winged helix-turn-helix domain-containing protein [Ilumatobacter sp.]
MQLELDGVPVPMQPQVMDVLQLLIEERDRVVPKQELLERVWGHTFVTESTLTSRIKSARQAIGDDGKTQRLIRTVHGRGYQFVGHLDDGHTEVASVTADTASHELPHFGSTLIGRASSVAAVEEHLRRSRLVTIVGPGGVGKTRLAVAVANRSNIESVFIDLTAISEPSLVMSHVASTIGLHANESVVDQGLVEYLSDRPMLLILDNAEHVIDASMSIGQLVGAVAELKVIVTSRERLRVVGEQVYHLEPLALECDPDESDGVSPAVALFEHHARTVDPAFELARFRGSVEKICRSVDGLPLAIELAAAQTGTLPPDMLAARLADRLRSSSSSRRDAPTRQRTMAATIDWSLHLLTADELRLFGRLGVFAGDVTLNAIERVCRDDDLPDPIDVLGRLIDHSLVRRTRAKDGSTRFGMLQLLRQRASELLDSDEAGAEVERRFCSFVADEMWRIDDEHWMGASTPWIEQMTAFRAEARRGFESAVSRTEWECAARIAGPLMMYYHREGGLDEGLRWLDLLAPHHHELSNPALGRILLGRGLLSWGHNDQQVARSTWEDAVVVLQQIADDARTAFVLASLAVTYLDEPREHEMCRELIDRGISLARSSKWPVLLAEVLNIAGEFARATGDDATARRRYDEAVELADEHHDFALKSISLANLCYLACHEGNFEEGRSIGREALRMCWALKRRQLAAWSVSELAGPAAGLGEYELAAVLIGGAERALEQLGSRIYPADLEEHERITAQVRECLGAERFEALRAEGRALSLDEVIAVALG